MRPIDAPRCARAWLACRGLAVALWLLGVSLGQWGATHVSPWLMIAGLLAWGGSEQVDRVSALVGWVRRKRPRSQ